MPPTAERRPQRTSPLVRCPGGYHASVPLPLPPTIDWDGGLVAALEAVTLMVGKLAGEGRRLPNPHLFIPPFVRRETVFSGRVEGIETTLAELLAADAGGTAKRNRADIYEVVSYVSTLEYGLARLQSLPLLLRLVCELH